jgi:DNA mismatch repair protein MutS2
MHLNEVKIKLEFDKVISNLKKYINSQPALDKCDSLEFITDRTDLEFELNKVIQMREIIEINSGLELTGLKDIRELVEKAKIYGIYLSPEKFLFILDFLRISKNVKRIIKSRYDDSPDRYNLLFEITDNLFVDKILEHHIESSIDANGEIIESSFSNLRNIRNDIRKKSDSLRKTLTKILKNVSEQELSQDDIISVRDGRFVIPVKVENKRRVSGIIHSTSATGLTVFIEPQETIEINNEIAELKFEEFREIEKILKELTSEIAKYSEQFNLNSIILTEIDFLQAKAKYAIESNSYKPIFDEEIDIINAYHPLLLQKHTAKDISPLNLKIGKEINTIIVTGPNAGGKTVALKTAGLLQLMLQSGLLIPADYNSRFRIFKKIFVNIGDEQSIENNLSSFSSHLKSIKNIIDDCDSESFVLIDEICSGTDPTFGGALSSSILKYLSEKNCVTIVTTHIGILKSFAYSTEKMENASLEFDVKTLSPNYKFITGIPGQSFTFEIAQKYNYSEEIINEARKYMGENQNNLEELIKDLNTNKQVYSDLIRKNEVEDNRLKELSKEYNNKVTEVRIKEKEILKDAKKKAEQLLKDGNRLIERTIKEIRENDKKELKSIKDKFKVESKEISQIPEERIEIEENVEILVNDIVRIKDSVATGEVMEIKGRTASISFNGMIVKAGINELEKVSKKQAKKLFSIEERIAIPHPEYSTRLDLRGLYPDDVKDKLDDFINNARLNSISSATIVHGKGTGKIRDTVRNLLKTNKFVTSYRYGSWNEGDTGVTIIELKY